MITELKKILFLFLFFLLCINTSHAELEKTTTRYEFSILGGHKTAYGFAGMKFGVNMGPYFQLNGGAGIGKLQSRVCAGFNLYPLPNYKLEPYFTFDYAYALSTKIANEEMYETYTLKANHYLTPALSLRLLLGTNFALKLKAGYSFLLSDPDKTVFATSQNQTQLESMKTGLLGGVSICGGLSITFRLKQKVESPEE